MTTKVSLKKSPKRSLQDRHPRLHRHPRGRRRSAGLEVQLYAPINTLQVGPQSIHCRWDLCQYIAAGRVPYKIAHLTKLDFLLFSSAEFWTIFLLIFCHNKQTWQATMYGFWITWIEVGSLTFWFTGIYIWSLGTQLPCLGLEWKFFKKLL